MHCGKVNMDILTAVKRAKKTGDAFYWYYEDGSRSEYSVSQNGLLLNYYGDYATFNVDRILSDKFTFTKRKKSQALKSMGLPK